MGNSIICFRGWQNREHRISLLTHLPGRVFAIIRFCKQFKWTFFFFSSSSQSQSNTTVSFPSQTYNDSNSLSPTISHSVTFQLSHSDTLTQSYFQVFIFFSLSFVLVLTSHSGDQLGEVIIFLGQTKNK